MITLSGTLFLLFTLLVSEVNSISANQPTYTIIIYMAADNDLFAFAGRNIKQMQAIGSNEHIKIVINFDMHRPGQPKVTKRFFVDRNKIMQIGPDMCMDSGDKQNLINCCQWAIENYPSQEYMLVLWNHGTGIIEPMIRRAINPSQLFNYNPTTKLIELNRSIGFIDYINNEKAVATSVKGICFDDTTGNYLTNQKLKEALHVICSQYLKGKKFAILACDACLMSMIEVASPLKDYVEYFVGSQEVELGTGYNYTVALNPFASGSLDKINLAKHIVAAYHETYSKITQDFTQSAFDLSIITALEDNINQVSTLLITALQKQKNRSVKEALRLSRHKNFCTYFDEPTYIDLGHFYANLLSNIARCELTDSTESSSFKQELSNALTEGLHLINTIVIANAVGKNLKNAKGISIYFPENTIHSSYRNSEFALKTHWLNFLITYFRT